MSLCSHSVRKEMGVNQLVVRNNYCCYFLRCVKMLPSFEATLVLHL